MFLEQKFEIEIDPMEVDEENFKTLTSIAALVESNLGSPSALRRLGLRPRGSHTLLVKFADERVNEIAAEASNWNYAYADSEASFSAA